MMVIINAIKSIARSKGRNILIGIIALTIAVSSCVALAIGNAANDARAAGLEMVNITASITADRQKMMSEVQGGEGRGPGNMEKARELMQKYTDLNLEQLQVYADSQYIKQFYYSAALSLNATGDLEPFSSESSSNDQNPSGPSGGGGFVIGGNGMSMGDFSISGYSAEEAMTKFMDGTAKIIDGEMFDINATDMQCVISSELATFNNLSVGDTLTLVNPNSETETYSLTIAGIYTDSSSSLSGSGMGLPSSMDPANQIYISYESLLSIASHSESVATTQTNDWGIEVSTALGSQLSGTFVFANRDDYDAFCTQIRDKGLSEYYTVSSPDIDSYEASLIPLENLTSFAWTMLWIVLGIGAIILIVINIFNIRERKYEVGVLTAIGIKKGKVAMQFVAELMSITMVAILLGAGIGAAISVPVSNNLLESQVASMQSQSQMQNDGFRRTNGSGPVAINGGSVNGRFNIIGGNVNVSYLDQINATISIPVLLQLIGIGVLLTIISSLAAVVFTLRYEPLQILANRA